ncbi:MAG: hypothetical protein JWP13_833 [Candidatus Saccharibacteria bacterium]|nr:hypothetical protein [Candidatus Saccharibacteria bacterium]
MLQTLITQFGITNGCSPKPFFGLKPWFQYLETDAQCNVINFKVLPKDGPSDFLLIALALVDDLLRIAGFVAIGYIIYGGILYVTSQGSSDQTSKAQSTITNALIGLVMAVVSVAFVSFLGNRIG